jgi:hypothetical protein
MRAQAHNLCAEAGFPAISSVAVTGSIGRYVSGDRPRSLVRAGSAAKTARSEPENRLPLGGL